MNNIKKVLIVNQNSGYLTIDVANAFTEVYDEVVVMYGSNRVTERKLHPKIKIQQTIVYNRTSTLKRLWTWGLCTVHLFFLLLWKYRGFKVLYYSNPPMSYINALLFSNPFSVVIFDTYPDALKLVGFKETSFAYRLWKSVNQKVFSKAEQIITLSNGMKNQLFQYVDAEKIKVVSIWPASENFKPVSKSENPFLKKHGLQDKFIVLYSGNMGIGHKLDILIEIAESMKSNKDILFLFIGDGAKKKALEDATKKKNLSNVNFMPWQDAETLPYSLAAGDIAVVALEPEATHASVPSKTFNYMAVGAPLLGIGNHGSDLEQLMINYKMGIYCNSEKVSEIKEFIIKLESDKKELKKLSSNSMMCVKKFNYSQALQYLF